MALTTSTQINSLQDMFASAQSGKLYYESIVAFGEMLGIIVFYLYNVKWHGKSKQKLSRQIETSSSP